MTSPDRIDDVSRHGEERHGEERHYLDAIRECLGLALLTDEDEHDEHDERFVGQCSPSPRGTT